MGRQYLKQKKYEEAVRCLQREVALEPDFEAYSSPAQAWIEQKNEEKWLATWEEYLQQESFGLEHTRARVNIAQYFMAKRQFQRAWPYAEWAMICAVDCLTGLKRWPEAEQYLRSSAERYPATSPKWYFWCLRTGFGDLPAARAFVRRVMNSTQIEVNPLFGAVFQACEGEKEQALATLADLMEHNRGPTTAIMVFALADDLKKADVRTRALEMIVDSAPKEEHNQPKLAEAARLARSAIEDESKLPQLEALAKECLEAKEEPRGSAGIVFLAGKTLTNRGKQEGEAFLRQMAGGPGLDYLPSAMAAAYFRSKEKND